MSEVTSEHKILLFGAGSVGAVYLYQLQQAQCSVTAVCRSNYDHVQRHGFTLRSLRYGNVQFRPERVVRAVSECAGEKFDYILVCSKSYPGQVPSVAESLRSVADRDPHTVIVLAQNGIMIEEEYAQAFPYHTILSGVVYLPATETSPGTIDYPEMLNLLELGTYPSSASTTGRPAALLLADLMIKGGGEATVHDDVQPARWAKLLMNAAWNPISALTLCTDGDFLQTSIPYAHELVWDVMLEIIALAVQVKVPGITEDVAKSKLAIAEGRAATGTGREMSMLHDVRRGRQFEVEAVLGNTVRLAKQQGLKLPRLETLYALSKARLESSLRQTSAR
ncbi:hypothetical protein RBB50_010134 [Rhinocladiella similis]